MSECNDCGTELGWGSKYDQCYPCVATRLCDAVRGYFEGEILIEHLEEAWKRYESEIKI